MGSRSGRRRRGVGGGARDLRGLLERESARAAVVSGDSEAAAAAARADRRGAQVGRRRDHGAAFSLGIDGDERLVVVQGIVRPKKIDLQQLFAEIRTELLHEHDLAPHAIVLVKCGEIPRTSSGKIQRNACRKLYLDGELQVVAQWNSESEKGVALAGASESGEAGTPAVGETESENISGDVAKGILGDLTLILSELKDGKLPSVLDGRTQLFADLNLESIDLVMLNEMIEQRYETVFPFQDFMAELGRKNQRDISIGQFVEFIRAYLQTMENSI